MRWRQIAIIGVGMLGGSIGLALRRLAPQIPIVGIGRNATRLAEALSRGAVTRTSTDLEASCAESDLIIVCTPVGSLADYIIRIAPLVPDDALITDVGSTKLSIVEAVAAAGWSSRFVGSHPLAGSEKTSVLHACDDLLRSKMVVVTPHPDTPEALTIQAEQLWQSLGARTCRMPAADHDEALAYTSHLPHLIAGILAAQSPQQWLPLVASGWRDTTRVAGGSPELWRDIVAENRLPVLRALHNFATVLHHWTETIENQDDNELEKLLAAGKAIRDAVGS